MLQGRPVGESSTLMGSECLYPCYVLPQKEKRGINTVNKDVTGSQSKEVDSKLLKRVSLP